MSCPVYEPNSTVFHIERALLIRYRAIETAAKALSAVMHDEKARPAAWFDLDEALKAGPTGSADR